MGIKTVQARWLDSIAYYTMVGEAYYRLGKYPEAMENYNSALRLYIQYADFMLRVQFPPEIQSGGRLPGERHGEKARAVRSWESFPTRSGCSWEH